MCWKMPTFIINHGEYKRAVTNFDPLATVYMPRLSVYCQLANKEIKEPKLFCLAIFFPIRRFLFRCGLLYH